MPDATPRTIRRQDYRPPAFLVETVDLAFLSGAAPVVFVIKHMGDARLSAAVHDDNVVGQTGRKFLLVRTQYSSETEGAQIAFDITGPWR